MRTDLLRRIEKLEATNPVAADRLQVAVRFEAGGKSNDALPGSAWREGAQAIVRSANETAQVFEARAFEHFAELDAVPWPLVVLFN